MRNLLFQLDRNTAVDVCFLEKQGRRADGEVFIPFRHRRIITLKLDCFFSAARFNLNLVAQRNRRDERLDLMKAVAAPAQNP